MFESCAIACVTWSHCIKMFHNICLNSRSTSLRQWWVRWRNGSAFSHWMEWHPANLPCLPHSGSDFLLTEALLGNINIIQEPKNLMLMGVSMMECFFLQIQRTPHGRLGPLGVKNAWHVWEHDCYQVRYNILMMGAICLMFNRRMFRMAGDVWGEYDQEGVRFTLLTREKVGRYQVSCFIYHARHNIV